LSFTIGLRKTRPQRQKGFPLPSLTQLRHNLSFVHFQNISIRTKSIVDKSAQFAKSARDSQPFAERSVFANLKNIFSNDKKNFADFAFKLLTVQIVVRKILTKPKPPISKKITKLLKVG